MSLVSQIQAAMTRIGQEVKTKQPLDSDLTAIAALTTTPYGRSLLTPADAASARTLLGAGSASVPDETYISATAPTNVGGYPEIWIDLSAGAAAVPGSATVLIMTQAAYDALAVKDPNTVYVVT